MKPMTTEEIVRIQLLSSPPTTEEIGRLAATALLAPQWKPGTEPPDHAHEVCGICVQSGVIINSFTTWFDHHHKKWAPSYAVPDYWCGFPRFRPTEQL